MSRNVSFGESDNSSGNCVPGRAIGLSPSFGLSTPVKDVPEQLQVRKWVRLPPENRIFPTNLKLTIIFLSVSYSVMHGDCLRVRGVYEEAVSANSGAARPLLLCSELPGR